MQQSTTGFDIPDSESAWAMLPTHEGPTSSLPAWARITAAHLPRTTANMLELDGFHRTISPLPPTLRAMARWVVATANRCPATQTLAAYDLEQTNASAAEHAALQGDFTGLPRSTQHLMNVARQLTEAAYKVTDDAMATVRATLGDACMVAFVQLIAFGNFQDRLLHCLGVADRADHVTGLRFRRPWEGGHASPRPTPKADEQPTVNHAWTASDFTQLQQAMEQQRDRSARISVPDFDTFRDYYPPDVKPIRIVWTLVCMGHSPKLAWPWTMGMRLFAEEARNDRVVEELLFWVITRENQCFY